MNIMTQQDLEIDVVVFVGLIILIQYQLLGQAICSSILVAHDPGLLTVQQSTYIQFLTDALYTYTNCFHEKIIMVLVSKVDDQECSMCNQPATAAAVLSMTILSPFSSLDQSAYFIDYTKGTYIHQTCTCLP